MSHKKLPERYLATGMVVSMFLWGLSWPSAKVLTHYCSVVNFTVYRYFLVVTTMLVLLPALGLSFRIDRKGIPSFIVSGLLLALYSFLFFRGLQAGTPGAGGVMVTTMNPIMAYLIGIFLSRRVPSTNETAGLLLGLAAGVVLLKVWDQSGKILESGNLYFLAAAFTWATMSKITARGARYGSSMGFSLWQYLVTLLCLLPFLNYREFTGALHNTEPLFWLNLLFGSVIVTALATTVYFYTTTRLGAERASSFIFLVPLGAALSSWIFLGEQIQPHTALGGIMGIAAVFLINRKKTKTIS